ncbi:NnrS family protein [Campylobacter curvus]|uniref:Heme-copper protein NnrS n=1 Tax=Campylobacter curvus (strain 525.92) TaxID=360105 RepID=A7H0P4_CAMC5|nr:NnrS family protein [Campylobacter curvus]EAU01432.1 putative heme-copper protein NnrS [Campylobacter curvus 525.92]
MQFQNHLKPNDGANFGVFRPSVSKGAVKFSTFGASQSSEQMRTPEISAFARWYERFCVQPHQPFFANGSVQLIAFTGLMLLAFLTNGVIGADITLFHVYAFVFVIFIQFFLGFLFVVFPKFLVQASIAKSTYMRQFWAYFIVSWGFFASMFFVGKFYVLFMALDLALQTISFITLFKIHARSLVKDKYDTKWVLIAFAAGLVANFAFLLSQVDTKFSFLLRQIAIYAGFYLFLFALIFAIAQRMIPFFTSVKIAGYKINKSKFLMEKLFFLLALKVLFTGSSLEILPDVLLFIFFVYELFFKWKLPFFKAPAILWVLFLSLYWIPFGFFITAFNDLSDLFSWGAVFEKASLHAFALGYFMTILIGFGTRVVLGHSGQVPHAGKFAIFIFLLLQVVTCARIVAALGLNFSLDYAFWINLSAALLVAALGIWGVKYVTILLKGSTPH